jgi:thiamine-phosphate pyrophosphorylase
MQRRQPLPRLWLMTDERQGEALWRALERLPKGSGVVFRHYALARSKRRALFEQVRRRARRRRLLLLLGGPPAEAAAWRADGSHGRGGDRRYRRLRSASAHDLREIRAAERAGADLLFVSPAFATRSHPGAAPLGPLRFGRLAASTRLPVIALGGVDAGKARRLAQLGIYGWGAIDAWSG